MCQIIYWKAERTLNCLLQDSELVIFQTVFIYTAEKAMIVYTSYIYVKFPTTL